VLRALARRRRLGTAWPRMLVPFLRLRTVIVAAIHNECGSAAGGAMFAIFRIRRCPVPEGARC